MTRPRLLTVAAALALVAALPLLADRMRSNGDRCAGDGVAVDPRYRARIIERDGKTRTFCGGRCAPLWWLRRGDAARSVFVTECAAGREIAAAAASYVQNFAAPAGGAPDAIRVFADEADAKRHVAAHGGRLLTGARRPFASVAPSHDDQP